MPKQIKKKVVPKKAVSKSVVAARQNLAVMERKDKNIVLAIVIAAAVILVGLVVATAQGTQEAQAAGKGPVLISPQ
jgi:hypothetical protein